MANHSDNISFWVGVQEEESEQGGEKITILIITPEPNRYGFEAYGDSIVETISKLVGLLRADKMPAGSIWQDIVGQGDHLAVFVAIAQVVMTHPGYKNAKRFEERLKASTKEERQDRRPVMSVIKGGKR